MQRRFYHSVRFRLLLVSLTLLGIPWAGYLFIVETEHFLRQSQTTNLQSSANALATVFASNNSVFSGSKAASSPPRRHSLYLHQWQHTPVVDGYADEWERYQHQFNRYQLPDGQLSASLSLGQVASTVYLLLKVHDSSPAYGLNGDSVDLSISDGGQITRLKIQPDAPGWVKARNHRGATLDAIRGEWQETNGGYTLELQMPALLLKTRLGLAINDSSGDSRLQTSHLFPADRIAPLVRHTPALQEQLQALTPDATRAWVVDHQGLVLAQAGQLDDQGPLSADQDDLPWLIRRLMLAVLPQQTAQLLSIPARQSWLDIAPIRDALIGRPGQMRRIQPATEATVVMASVPIYREGKIIGAVMLEQTTNAILSIQNLALQRLFGITLGLFIVTSLGLLLFASLLTARIRKLRNQMDAAVSHDGRIVGELAPNRKRDELGELQQGLAAVLGRLSEYNHYLEAMASRLAHELRTPLSVVRTSLDNAAQTDDPAACEGYIQRAHSGAERLELILKQLREASRLEQAFESAEFAKFDLLQLLQHQITAMRGVWPDVDIQLQSLHNQLMTHSAPDLVVQALEKLVSNAVDFHQPGSPIVIELTVDDASFSLAVINHGPKLPEGMDLFKSMVSGRSGRSEEPHLGLGLYLVRLIAEFHRGKAFAEDLPQQRVRIGIQVPKAKTS